MTSWEDLKAQVHPGDGLVVRTAGGVLVVPSPSSHQGGAIERLIALVRDAQPGSGRAVARRVAAMVAAAEGDEVPADLAVLAPLGGGDVAALVMGDVELEADSAEGHVHLSGRESLTWVDKVLRAPARLAVTTAGGARPAPSPYADLVVGAVAGSGVTLEPRGGATLGTGSLPSLDKAAAPAPASAATDEVAQAAPAYAPPPQPEAYAPPAPAPAPTPAPPPAPPAPPAPSQVPAQSPAFESVALEAEPHAPLPVEDAPTDAMPSEPAVAETVPPAEVGGDQVLVEGVYCKNGHFNDPHVQFCTVCGINMAQQTPAVVKRPRPPLGVLVFDDGSVFQLDRDYVLGRQPEVAEEVSSGTARPLRLDDAGGTVSRAHAIVRLEDWDVRLLDARSANGTYTAPSGSTDWQPVPQQGVVLTPGTQIQLGRRTLVYESHRGRR